MIEKKNKPLSIMIVGDGSSTIYANAFYNAACKIKDIKAHRFDYGKMNLVNTRKNIFLRIEFRYSVGPDITLLNKKLLKEISEKKIEFVFLYTARLISVKTIKCISKMGIYIATYCNDDPFSSYFPKYFWRNFIKSLQYCDHTYIFREYNKEEYYKKGSKIVSLLRSYYIEERNFRIKNIEIEKEFPDVVFIGHYEEDGRDKYIEALLKKGISVGVSDMHTWKNRFPKENNLTFLQDPINKYNELINKAKICIVFLSSINKDTYTTRCFEIPATGTMMIAPYTDDLASMFVENKEVVFYRDIEDFVEKIIFYLNNPNERIRIAEGGYQRVHYDRHEVLDRIKQVLQDYFNEQNKDATSKI